MSSEGLEAPCAPLRLRHLSLKACRGVESLPWSLMDTAHTLQYLNLKGLSRIDSDVRQALGSSCCVKGWEELLVLLFVFLYLSVQDSNPTRTRATPLTPH